MCVCVCVCVCVGEANFSVLFLKPFLTKVTLSKAKEKERKKRKKVEEARGGRKQERDGGPKTSALIEVSSDSSNTQVC